MQAVPFRARGPKLLALLMSAVVLSSLTVVLGAAPFRALRTAFGRSIYWLGGVMVVAALMAVGAAPYALLVLAVFVLAGVYSEVEAHGESVFMSGAVACLASFGASALATGLYLHQSKISFMTEIRAQLTPLVAKMAEFSGTSSGISSGIDVDMLMQQLPSGVLISLILALAISLIWDRRVAWLARVPGPENATEQGLRLAAFRVPDATVWLVVVSIFGEFFKHGVPWFEILSANLLNVLVVLYFFQGLAVVVRAFRHYKISPFWQGIWYILIVFQLFLLVSLIGFADFWLDFRERLARKPIETNHRLL